MRWLQATAAKIMAGARLGLQGRVGRRRTESIGAVLGCRRHREIEEEEQEEEQEEEEEQEQEQEGRLAGEEMMMMIWTRRAFASSSVGCRTRSRRSPSSSSTRVWSGILGERGHAVQSPKP